MSFSVEKNNTKPFLRVCESEYDYSCGYYSQNCWVDDDRLVLVKSKRNINSDFKELEYVLIDVINKTEKFLVRVTRSLNSGDSNNVVYGNLLYYVSDDHILCSINVDTLEKKEIFECDTPIAFPHMTADGRYINWYGKESNKDFQTCMRIDLKTGEVIKMLEKGFLPPFKVANHFMLCPTNPDMLFFSHEGDATYITNRLWICELGKEPYNLAKQRLDENGNLMDCFGHESWSADGKGVYFVKYLCSPEPPHGIGYVDIETRQSKMMFTGNYYWHVCAAPNGKYLAADLQPVDEEGLISGVCLIDIEKNTEKILVTVRNNKKHPGHPHPQFNPSCNKICFHDIIDEDTVSVGIINI